MTPANSDTVAIESFLSGEKNASQQVEKSIQIALHRWKGKFGYEMDDIISDVRYKLLISLRRQDFQFRSSLHTYIRQIVDHTCIDYYRLQKRFEKIEADDLQPTCPDPAPDEKLQRREDARLMYRILRLVSKECLKLWRMQLKEGKTCREIGNVIGKSEGNIRRKLWTCRKSAREIRKKMLKKGKRF